MSAIAHAKKPSNVGSPQRESWGCPSVTSSKGMSNRPPTSGDMTWPLRVIPCQTGFPLGSTKATLDWDGASLPVSSGCSVQKNPLECRFRPTCADVLGLPNTCPPSWLGRSASRWMAAERRSVERQCWVSPTLSIMQDSGFLPSFSLHSVPPLLLSDLSCWRAGCGDSSSQDIARLLRLPCLERSPVVPCWPTGWTRV